MNDYSQTVKVNDRATMVNLMVGLYGYTLCSGIVCEELNGGDYRVIPLSDDSPINGVMKVGYIVKKKPDPQQRRQAVYRENTGISSRGTGRFVQLIPSCFVHIVNICLDIMPLEYMKRTML